MSQSEQIKPEYKTIRVPAATYYKIVEITGMVNAITAINFSISDVVAVITKAIYQNAYPNWLNLINDPEALQKNKEQFQKGAKQIYDLLKNVKIKE